MAIADFKKQLELDSENMNGWYYLITSLFRSGRVDEAVKGEVFPILIIPTNQKKKEKKTI